MAKWRGRDVALMLLWVALGLGVGWLARSPHATELLQRLAHGRPAGEAEGEGEEESPPSGHPEIMNAARRLFPRGEPPRLIYLNREGAELKGGPDDARLNISSVVAQSPGQRAVIPAFRGTPARFDAIRKCIADKFAPYHVRVVDRRPVDEDYVMAMLGGEPHDLGFDVDDGHTHSHATGLAPFSGELIPDAVVFVFTRVLKESTKNSCEVAGMEIAHAFGLDHARHCKDLMTYKRPCGSREFVDEEAPCGEHEDRPCKDGAKTQNSHRRLLALLGPALPTPAAAH